MLKLQYFGHLMWSTTSLEKTLMQGKIEGKMSRRQQRMRWFDSIMNSKYMNLSIFWVAYMVKVSASNAGDLDSDPWVGKILWRRKWQPTPVLLLENPMDGGMVITGFNRHISQFQILLYQEKNSPKRDCSHPEDSLAHSLRSCRI